IRDERSLMRFRLEVEDAVESIELTRNGTARGMFENKISKVVSAFFTKLNNPFACSACKLAVSGSHQWTRGLFLKAIEQLCRKVAGKPPSVCRGVAQSSGSVVYDVLRHIDLGYREVKPMTCCALGNVCPMPHIVLDQLKLPPKTKLKRVLDGRGTASVLHLSDLHYDREHEVGAEADCNKPICCQKDSNSDTKTKEIKRPASKWGEYNCDANLAMISSMLANAGQREYEMVLFTGDVPAHDLWKEERERSSKMEAEAFELPNRHFNQTKVYPAIGNHESVPTNQFSFLGSPQSREFYL
ncbi:hypothetical protein L0F63_004807, partial [Massospora cicadina]